MCFTILAFISNYTMLKAQYITGYNITFKKRSMHAIVLIA